VIEDDDLDAPSRSLTISGFFRRSAPRSGLRLELDSARTASHFDRVCPPNFANATSVGMARQRYRGRIGRDFHRPVAGFHDGQTAVATCAAALRHLDLSRPRRVAYLTAGARRSGRFGQFETRRGP